MRSNESMDPARASVENRQTRKSTGSSSWICLFTFTRKSEAPVLILAAIFAALSGLALPVLSLLLGRIFDAFSDYSTSAIDQATFKSQTTTYVTYLAGLGAANLMLNSLFYISWAIFGELQAKCAQDELYSRLLQYPLTWFDGQEEGVLAVISRAQSQIHDLQVATSQPLGLTIQSLISAASALILAFYTCWDLTLVTMSTLPLIVVILAWISARMQPGLLELERSSTAAAKASANALRAIDTVICYNGQNAENKRFQILRRQIDHHYAKLATLSASQIASVRFITLSMFVQGFWYGTRLVFGGQKTAGQILTAFWACLMATQCMEQFLPSMTVLEKGRVAGKLLAERVQDGIIEQSSEDSQDISPQNIRGDVTFTNVSFIYPAASMTLALRNINLTFAAGQTTFLVGKSGSGKSTIASLLLRLYDPTEGSIRVGGQDIRNLDIRTLRRSIFLIEQHPSLFNDTLLNNIVLRGSLGGNRHKRQLESGIAFAELNDLINDLPDGLETRIGHGATSVSGGQGQRISLSRAGYRDAPILVLDEATSALDLATKTRILSRLRRWRKGKTTIIVTHDLSQITDSDFVYAMESGRVVQEGYWRDIAGPCSSFSPLRDVVPAQPRGETTDSPRDTRSVLSTCLRSRSREVQSYDGGESPSQLRSYGLGQELLWQAVSSRFSTGTTLRTSAPLHRAVSQGTTSDTLMELASLDRSSHAPRGHATIGQLAPQIEPSSDRKDGQGMGENESLAKISLLRALRTLWPNLRYQHRLCLVSGGISTFVHAMATPAFALVFSKLLDVFLLSPDKNSEFAFRWAMAVLGMAASDAIASYSMHYLLELAGQAWISHLSLEGFRRALSKPRPWFDLPGNSTLNITNTLERCPEDVRDIVTRLAAFLAVAVCMTVTACVWSIALCWRLALVGIGSAPVLYGVSRLFEYVGGIWERRRTKAMQRLTELSGEAFINITTVKVMSLETAFRKRFHRATRKALLIGAQKAATSGLLFGASEASSTLVTALIFWYGSVLVASGEASVPNVTSVFTLLLMSLANANANIASIPQVVVAKTSASRLLRLAELPVDTADEQQGHVRLDRLPGPIVFRGLVFRYPSRPQQEVLSDLNLTIPLRKSTGLVGASGSGKSTILSLILGLNSASEERPRSEHHGGGGASVSNKDLGRSFTIGGLPYAACHIPTLRGLIGYVPQEVLLLPGTITENIAYGLEGRCAAASEGRVRWAAGVAGIDGFIRGLPNGYDTRIGDGGLGLSGGQAQMLGIARAVARKPQVVVMDEPTANLDPQSAAGLRSAIRHLVGVGWTVVVATHSADLMASLDHLTVLEGGAVVEQGCWSDLVRRKDSRLLRLVGDA